MGKPFVYFHLSTFLSLQLMYYFCLSRTLGPEAMYEYELFAVINHEGQIDNGHYTNFARFGDEVRRINLSATGRNPSEN